LPAILVVSYNPAVLGQSDTSRRISGAIVTREGEAVPGARVTIISVAGEEVVVTSETGDFRAVAPIGKVTLRVEGKTLETRARSINENEGAENLRIEVSYVIPPFHDSIVIEASALDPGIDRRNDAIYKNTLFSRDDQVFETLDAGINAGQHEGGGKSV